MVSWLKLSILSILYFVQGAPYGFQSACLPILLRSQGLSYTSIGVLKLLFLPWVCKPLYAPYIEKTHTKKWWLQLSISSLGLTCLITGLLVKEDDLIPLSCILLLLNFFSSVQDIAVDSLAVYMLDETELGAGNTVQVVAYKAGSMMAGSLLLIVRELFGWTIMFIAFASIYFAANILISLMKFKEKTNDDKSKEIGEISIIRDLKSILNVQGTSWMIFFLLYYKLCERSEQTFMLVLVDKKVPKEELAILSTFIRAFSIMGSLTSGLLLTKNSSKIKSALLSTASIRFIGILGLTILVYRWDDWSDVTLDPLFKYLGFSLICLTSIGAGSITTNVFTLMMSLSQKASNTRGTHYSLLATCEVLGKLMFAAIAGYLIDIFGLKIIFSLFTFLAVTVLPIAYYAPRTVINKANRGS